MVAMPIDALRDAELQREAEHSGIVSDKDTERIPWYPEARKYSTQEILLDTIVNAVGVAASALGAAFLLWRSLSSGDEWQKTMGLGVYSFGIMGMMNASFCFNRYPWREDWFDLLFFMDTSAINIMIASCYTPMAIQARCFKLLTTVWCLALFGIFWQCVQFGIHHKKRYKVELVLFLTMGWLIVAFRHDITPYFHPWCSHVAICFGVLYSGGAIINAWEALPYHKPIWHLCVLIATTLTYTVAYIEIAAGVPMGQTVRKV